MPAKKVVISGYFGFSNLGDEVILSAMLQNSNLLLESAGIRGYETIPVVLSAEPQNTSFRYDIKAVNRWNPLSVFLELLCARVFICGGGGILQEVTSRPTMFYYVSLIVLARLLGCIVVIYQQGIGPVRTPSGRLLLRTAAAFANRVIVRDKQSAQLLRNAGHNGPLYLGADIGWFWQDTGVLRRPEPDAQPWFRVAVCVSRQMLKRESHYAIADALAKFSRIINKQIKFVFIPFHKLEDTVPAMKVVEHLRERKPHLDIVIVEWHNPDGVLEELSRVDVVVAMRYHAVVAAVLSGKPFVALSYDPKIENLLEELGEAPCRHIGDLPRRLTDASASVPSWASIIRALRTRALNPEPVDNIT